MIDSVYFWFNISVLAVGTLAIRFSIIAVSSRVVVSERTKEIFSFIPAAILPALITPMVFFHKGHVAWAFEKERTIVLILAAVVFYFSRSTLITIAFGMIALFLITH